MYLYSTWFYAHSTDEGALEYESIVRLARGVWMDGISDSEGGNLEQVNRIINLTKLSCIT